MNINRHNYEEYFILYMDNELSVDDRQMVEDFVRMNPDLKDELDVLLQSRLIPEKNIVFEGKEELLRNESGASINLSNYEEWFMLYVDDELDPERKKEVDKFIAVNPTLKNEFTLLQKTRSHPEEIVFPYKEALYRKTEKVRIVSIRWRRIAAAAILLFAIGITAVILLNNNRKTSPVDGTTIAKTTNEQKGQTKNSVVVKPKTNNVSIRQPYKELTAQQPTQQKNQNNSDEKKKQQIFLNKKDESETAKANDNKPSNNLPQPLDNPNIKSDAYNTDVAKVPANVIENKTKIEIPLVTKPIDGTSPIKISEKTETEPQYASLEEGQNKKSRGFFRKAVRFVEKTTKIKPANDDDRILIGGLAVKLN